ncbi:hypothetical protein [Reichenbachiella agariperforans]|uniref:hypothetical protein n=1 Tax=Reichenbachiella agariperforans TaxID=156994 RepID=UPI001C09405E|nr:hypothetical protein [Reichenbachiella agariperforans]MBU2912918.1 hypothetical protein [Reichenbachiella agariperforans]
MKTLILSLILLLSLEGAYLWKREFLANAEGVFEKKGKSKKSQVEDERDQLLKVIGQLKVENDFLNVWTKSRVHFF